MNIKKAKEEIKYAIQAYLAKDEFGEYRIPAVRQRPVLLMGAPGIGKTAVMEQVARECGVALVSYSITHHTRQSAIGLPFISKKEYGGKEYTVTEYTMSEIIASVYDKMEETGLQEGILFIDEINCASETLAPAMLQFLQYKTFGTHKVPDGFVIVTAVIPDCTIPIVDTRSPLEHCVISARRPSVATKKASVAMCNAVASIVTSSWRPRTISLTDTPDTSTTAIVTFSIRS